MKFIYSLVVTVVATIASTSCHQKQIADTTADSVEIIVPENDLNSIIKGKVVSRSLANDMPNTIYQHHYSYAEVIILEIKKRGQNYHGQFNVADTIRLFFNFTMENTATLFPELNDALAGLEENDVFQAELHEKAGSSKPISVRLYSTIE